MISELSARSIAIIGGGFSGVLVLANLIEQAKTSLSITLFEAKNELGLGVAYSTNDTEHLLNVRAGRMGAFAGKPEHFWHWLKSEGGKSETRKIWPGHAISSESFVPRRLYRAYIQDILKSALEVAEAKKIAVNIRRETLQDIDSIQADAVVLATGNEPPKSFGFEEKSGEQYVGDIWQPPAGSVFPCKIGTLPADSNIVIIGTGLTAIDAILTLHKNNFKGTIYAMSRGGHRPATHFVFTPYDPWEWTKNPDAAPKTALGLLHGLKKEAKKAENWQAVIDSLRPITQTLWKNLPLAEQKKFLRRLFTFWGVHRHRMAPEISQTLDDLIAAKRLKIISARIIDVSEKLLVRYKKRGDGEQTLQAALVINCTGPDWRLSASSNPFIQNLLKRGLVKEHATGIGLKIAESSRIFPIGPLMIGELLESVAVPELRDQAFTTAVKVLKSLAKEHA